MISGYDIESSQLVGEGDFAALKTFLIDNTPAVLTAYDEAERAEPDLKSAIGTLRAVSTGARDAAIEAHDLSELRTLLRDIPEIAQSGDAANALNAYTQANCGFSTGA